MASEMGNDRDDNLSVYSATSHIVQPSFGQNPLWPGSAQDPPFKRPRLQCDWYVYINVQFDCASCLHLCASVLCVQLTCDALNDSEEAGGEEEPSMSDNDQAQSSTSQFVLQTGGEALSMIKIKYYIIAHIYFVAYTMSTLYDKAKERVCFILQVTCMQLLCPCIYAPHLSHYRQKLFCCQSPMVPLNWTYCG